MDIIDLRSDTITKPSPAMRQAMANAEVGDDVFGEDPTVNRLQEMAAELTGQADALFVPSGTMANSLAIKILTSPGDEVIMEEGSHPFNNESGGPAVISGVQIRTLKASRGILKPDQIKAAIRPDDIHVPPTSLISIENTSNRGGGSIYPLETIKEISEIARKKGISLHMDGARLFNACVSSGVKPDEYGSNFDTVSFCLSKGLGAPVGSLLCGSKELIKNALRWRKLLGGGMRQVGILAAAGLYALDNNIERLADDHENAKILAQGLSEMDEIEIVPDDVESNIVAFNIKSPDMSSVKLQNTLKENGVLVLAIGPKTIRAVTHLDVDRKGIEKAVEVIKSCAH